MPLDITIRPPSKELIPPKPKALDLPKAGPSWPWQEQPPEEGAPPAAHPLPREKPEAPTQVQPVTLTPPQPKALTPAGEKKPSAIDRVRTMPAGAFNEDTLPASLPNAQGERWAPESITQGQPMLTPPTGAQPKAVVPGTMVEPGVERAVKDEDRSVPFGSVMRGLNREVVSYGVLGAALGLGSDEQLADLIVEGQESQRSYPIPPELKRFYETYASTENKGIWETTKLLTMEMLNDPVTLPTLLGEMSASMLSVLLGTVGGGVAGGFAGPAGAGAGAIIGGGVGSGLSDAGATFIEHLQEAGVDLNDREAVLAALRNPEIRNEAEARMMKHGSMVGLASMFGLKYGGKVFGRFLTPEATFAQKAGGLAGGSLLDATIEAGGQSLGDIWAKGEFDYPAAFLEFAMSGATGMVEIPTTLAMQELGPRVWGTQPEPMTEEEVLQSDLTDIAETTEEGEAQRKAGVQEKTDETFTPEKRTKPEDSIKGDPVEFALNTYYNEWLRVGTPDRWSAVTFSSREALHEWLVHLEDLVREIEVGIINKYGLQNSSQEDILSLLADAPLTREERAFLFEDDVVPTSLEELSALRSVLTPVLDGEDGAYAELTGFFTFARENQFEGSEFPSIREHIPVLRARFLADSFERQGLDLNKLVTQILKEYLVAFGPEAQEVSELRNDIDNFKKLLGKSKLTFRMKQNHPLIWSPDSEPLVRREKAKVSYVDNAAVLQRPEIQQAYGKDIEAWARRMHKVMQKMAGQLGLRRNMTLEFVDRFYMPDGSEAYGAIAAVGYPNKSPYKNYQWNFAKQFKIKVALNPYGKPSDILNLTATMWHEFGHALQYAIFDFMPLSTRQAVVAEYARWRNSLTADQKTTFDRLVATRDNFISQHLQTEMGNPKLPLVAMNQKQREYWLGFEEWFAESVAKWAVVEDFPVAVHEKAFRAMGKALRRMFRVAAGAGIAAPESFSGPQALTDFLEARRKSTALHGMKVVDRLKAQGKVVNDAVLERLGLEPNGTMQAEELSGVRMMLEKVFDGAPPDGVLNALSEADRVSWLYKWAAGVQHLAKRFSHVRDVQVYAGLLEMAEQTKNFVWNRALTTIKKYNRLSRKEKDALVPFIDAYMNRDYMGANEKGIRLPTDVEMRAMLQKHKVSKRGFEVFQAMTEDFKWFLNEWRKTRIDEAMVMEDPVAQAGALERIEAQFQALLKVPYFPALRFGDWIVRVKNDRGVTTHREHAKTEKEQKKLAAQIERTMLPGERIELDRVPEQVRPMLGMPPGMLDNMLNDPTLNLDAAQRKWVEEFRFDTLPSRSFRHRFRKRKLVPGYSRDFARAFANYFFHGGNFLARIQFAGPMRDAIGRLRKPEIPLRNRVGLTEIANYLDSHLEEWLNPRRDFMTLRGVMVWWTFGFSVAAAALNATQVPLISTAYLGDKFSDLGSVAAVTKALVDLKTFYHKGNTDWLNEPRMAAIAEAIKDGTLDESQATELAALGEGRNLDFGLSSGIAEAWQGFLKVGMSMFQGVEKFNRRVTFNAAWDLASSNPNAKIVEEAKKIHLLKYNELVDKGVSAENAAAYVTAKHVVNETQYNYTRPYRPRYMRGKLGTLFIFKTFTNSQLAMMAQNPGTAVRYLVLLGAAAGMMGLPGSEDIEGVMKAIAWQLFGKDFDLDRELRKFIVETTENPEFADMILHGTARESFGWAALADMLGNTLGMGDVPVPQVDMSRSVGAGQILPFNVGELFGPQQDTETAAFRGMKEAVGPAYGFGFQMYKAISDLRGGSNNNFKNWTAMAPRALRGPLASWDVYQQEALTDRSGAAVLQYSREDPQHMADLFGKALGFQPTREARFWDMKIAQSEVAAYWQIRKEMLMGQLFEATKGGDSGEVDKVVSRILQFNESLPKGMEDKGFQVDDIKASQRSRIRNAAKKELGLPLSGKDVGIYEEVKKLYPNADLVQEAPKGK